MVEHVVSHLVSHHGAYLGGGAAVEQVIVERNARGAGKTAYVGAHAVALFRCIEAVNIFGRDTVGPGHGEYLVLELALGQRLVFIEYRGEENGSDKGNKSAEDDSAACTPQPPARAGLAQRYIQCDNHRA